MPSRILFSSLDSLTRSIYSFCDREYIPFERKKEDHRVRFLCAKGIRHNNSRKNVRRPNEGNSETPGKKRKEITNILYAACPASLTFKKNESGSFYLFKSTLAHNHSLTKEEYFEFPFVRKRSISVDSDFIKPLIKAKAKPSNIAHLLKTETGIPFSRKQVANLAKKLSLKETPDPALALNVVVSQGGDCQIYRDPNSNIVDVIFIQTKKMKEELFDNKPHVFECDTTFNTNIEKYKLWISAYRNFKTDMFEIAGIILLSHETADLVKIALEFFKDSLPKISMPLILFVDKNFNHVNVLRNTFINCTVLLCHVHTYRYFKDKVFNKKALTRNGISLKEEEKNSILDMIRKIRDAKTEQIANELETKLREKMNGYTVCPGTKRTRVEFNNYYDKNWKSCKPMWCTWFRRRLPTMGINDTQGVERQHGVFKQKLYDILGHTPSIQLLIETLPSIIDNLISEHKKLSYKRPIYRYDNPVFKKAIDDASYILNRTGKF